MNSSSSAQSPYAGRWVALVRDKIIAQGGTPRQALMAAQARYKEKTEIRFMPLPIPISPTLKKIIDVLPPDGEIYLVGGAVRDLFTNRRSPDFDLTVPTNGISLARKIANALQADFMALDTERDTGRVILTEEDGTTVYIDIATYRGNSLEEDLKDRDFTINAIALNLRDFTILDPLNGTTDIRSKIIRACSPQSFANDPVRILRAIRQAAAFGFSIEKPAREQMKASASLLKNVSIERVRDELFKILSGPKASAAIRALDMLGALEYTLPEVLKMKGVMQSPPHIHDVWTHTLAVVDQLDDLLTSSLRIDFDPEKTSDMFMGLVSLKIGRYREQIARHFENSLNPTRSHRSLLFFAALYHDICKPDTRFVDEDGRVRFFDHDIKGAEITLERAQKLNLSNDEVERLKNIVRHHMRFHFFVDRLEREAQPPSRKAIYRFFRDTGNAGIDLILLALADVRGTRGNELTQQSWTANLDIARILLENYWEHPEEVINPPRLVDGNQLMKELSLPPGKIVGQILEAIRENQAAGKINTEEQAFAFAHDELKKIKAS